MLYVGFWLGFLGPILLLIRGKIGTGNFLSRLPMSRHEVFLGKVLFLVLVYIVVTASLCVGVWAIVGIIKLLQPSLQFSGVPDGRRILKDAITFFKTMPFFFFLGALSLWLQKRVKTTEANLLVLLGVMVVFCLIPIITVLATGNSSITISSRDIAKFLNAYKTPAIIALNLALFFGAMGLYRLHHFRNF